MITETKLAERIALVIKANYAAPTVLPLDRRPGSYNLLVREACREMYSMLIDAERNGEIPWQKSAVRLEAAVIACL